MGYRVVENEQKSLFLSLKNLNISDIMKKERIINPAG
jgi:hypothetical protein